MKIATSFAAAMILLAGCSPANEDDEVAVNVSEDQSVDIAAPPVATGNVAGEDVASTDDLSGAPPAAPLPTDAWVGKWVGVEGLALDIKSRQAPGEYDLAVSLLDGTENYVGTADGNVIRFTRDGKSEAIRKASGAETGLKYLADKENCLVIKSGEGFCRD